MTAGPFIPTPLATPVVASEAVSVTRALPYISLSQYRFAPTAVGTTQLVPGSTSQTTDSAASLAQVIQRASSWIDQFCFHTPDGTLAASVTTESMWVKIKPNGDIPLISKYRPILDVQGVAIGPIPGDLTSLTNTVGNSIWIENKIVWLAASWWATATFPGYLFAPTFNGGVYAVWSYTNGYPHASLASSVSAGATSLTLTPGLPGATTLSGVYPGTQLTIKDNADTEVITVSSVSGKTVTIPSPGLQFAHTVPTYPDSIMVTAVPWAVEQACISLTSMLIKTRGTRAQVLPSAAGSKATKQALAQAGALEDFEIACNLLQPYQTVFLAH